MLFPFRQNLVSIVLDHPMVYYGAAIVELVLVFVASGAARRNTPAALPLFLVYSALNGFNLELHYCSLCANNGATGLLSHRQLFSFASHCLVLRLSVICQVFERPCFAALIGIIVASLVNLFIGSDLMSYVISLISVLIFSGLIASDNQMIKQVYQASNGQVGDGWAVAMALSLYLDFINLFISLLRLLEEMTNSYFKRSC
ncbi:Bax inhibitor-1/YccA family protein [Streptococcus equi subsp. equi]|nr:Bax inhibitor-1/YccA family protein [Streptococcus equi subsp. equi]